MKVKELVIEGFKSYPVRTVISKWDPSFNAITGLNGSGKSNILDAIAFVLGITNMSVMRAANQQDLIYKRGQAGITKASVTIIFDNSDLSTAPQGYDQKEITVTRQVALPNISKYLLNGKRTDQKQVQDLFQAVGLNINNPNFVIMQGRITKVLNMKPLEILGMIEEAAGTRMFESKKASAKKTMAKKEKRVAEITTVFEDEITPKLDRLRKEKQAYIQYQKGENELEALGKKLHALEWQLYQQKVKSRDADCKKKMEELKTEQEAGSATAGEIEAAEERVQALQERREKELQKGGKINKLQEACDAAALEIDRVGAKLENSRRSLEEEKRGITGKQEQITELESILADKQAEVDRLGALHAKLKNDHDAQQEHLNSDEGLLQSLQTGLSKSADQSGGGYLGQIAAAKSRITQSRTEEETLRTTLGMRMRELDDLEKKCKSEAKSAGEGKRRLESLKKELSDMEIALGKCGWNAEQEQSFNDQFNTLKTQIRQLTADRDRLKYSISSLDFDYHAPPDFDRSQVKGTVGRWVKLDQENHDKAAALETAAGNRLYQVIIENERVGKTLLTPGKCRLPKRTTFIPLNKVDTRTAKDREQAILQSTKGKAHLALSLVGYPPELYNAMAYVFGSTFVCDDTDAAKQAAFTLKVRSVTLQGDLYEPSGTLTGGSASRGTGLLLKVQEVLDAEATLAEATHSLQKLETHGQQNKAKRDAFLDLSRKVEMKKHELQLAQGTVDGSNATHAQNDLSMTQDAVKKLNEDLKAAKEKQKLAEAEVKKLERDMDEFKDDKDGKIEELKTNITKQKSALQKHAVALKLRHKELQTAEVGLDQTRTEINKAKAQIEAMGKGVGIIEKELEVLKNEDAKLQASHKEAEAKLERERETVSKYDKELKKLDASIREKKTVQAQREADIVKLENSIQELAKERETALHQVKSLEDAHEWIKHDSALFGQAGGAYDFRGVDHQQLKTKIVDLEKTQKTLKKKVNTKAAHMINDVEKRETELQKNLKTVLDDKRKIEEKVEEIDEYKRETLEKTWQKVSRDFGDIFRELLPGNSAKLQVADGKDLMNGLEVKVQLGTVWKQSLTELSGGQRSLIALSLIMALLQFKPAPMYILDEIDAALDLSHTQHIGHLFKTRFKGSQFIVVSLKEGLFTNANVLFKARFHDGTSMVDRTETRSTR